MRVFCSVLAVVGILSATETSAANWNEGTTYLSDGMVDQLERGTIWQREFGESEAAPVLLAEMRKRAKRSASGTARTAFDGRWSVIVSTRSGPCDPQYRFGVVILNGNITYEGASVAGAQGRVSPSRTVPGSGSPGPQSPTGQGRLSRDHGTGTWRGQGAGGACSGTWQATRQR